MRYFQKFLILKTFSFYSSSLKNNSCTVVSRAFAILIIKSLLGFFAFPFSISLRYSLEIPKVLANSPAFIPWPTHNALILYFIFTSYLFAYCKSHFNNNTHFANSQPFSQILFANCKFNVII